MTTKPLLTVVMPTHNRAQYAQFAIKSVLALESAALQLVVHDTSETDELERFVAANISDGRLKYIHYPHCLSMTDNHNAAMQAADGEYVCLIGDDDTIMPEALDAVAWAQSNGIDALSPLVVANYAWPDFRSRFFGMGHAGRVYIKKRFESARTYDAKASLRQALQGAAQGTEGLPKVYHGFVRRSVMESIRERSGAYFHGSSPDVSGAVGVALMISSFVELGYPLTLPGASGKSNTGRSAVNTHKGALAKDSQTAEFAAKGWPAEVPRFFSVETVWAHAAIETIRRLDAASLKDFDFIRLYATCWLRHKEYRGETLQAFRGGQWALSQQVASPKLSLALVVAEIAVSSSLRLAKRALTPTAAGGRGYIPNLQTIEDAQTALIAYLGNNSTTYQRFVADFSPQR
jgi:hypothetical protein